MSDYHLQAYLYAVYERAREREREGEARGGRIWLKGALTHSILYTEDIDKMRIVRYSLSLSLFLHVQTIYIYNKSW